MTYLPVAQRVFRAWREDLAAPHGLVCSHTALATMAPGLVRSMLSFDEP